MSSPPDQLSPAGVTNHCGNVNGSQDTLDSKSSAAVADLTAGRWAGGKASKGAAVLVTMLTGDSKVPPPHLCTLATEAARYTACLYAYVPLWTPLYNSVPSVPLCVPLYTFVHLATEAARQVA